jgi:hypothetical protein
MVGAGCVRRDAAQNDGWSMRRVIVISLAGVALSGCASFSVPGLDFLTPSPQVTTLQLESMPPGAEARTSAGPSCRTPCSVSVPAAPLTVTYTLDRYEPQTVAVQPLQQAVVNPNVDAGGAGYVVELDPNPVFAQLASSAPPKRTTKRPPPKRVAKRPPADAPPSASSPFPAPAASSPFPSR